MKITIKYILTLAICVFTLASCKQKDQTKKPNQESNHKAPPHSFNEQQIGDMVKNLSTTLQLTNEQTSLISELYTAHFKEMNTIVSDPENFKKVTREQMEKRKTDFENEVKSLLTDDQKKQYETYIVKNDPRNMDNKQRPQR